MNYLIAFCLTVGLWVGVQVLFADHVPERTASHMIQKEARNER